MRIPSFRHIIILLLPLMLFACVRSRHGELFDDMERRIKADPRAAAAYADSLAADSALLRDMTEYDRARFGLLRIKSADKAYIRHTSDSLLLTVTEYYERHPKAEEYAEALYYGGRVYADLGDSPTALRYFQQAIDAQNPHTKVQKNLMIRTLSQTGRLLDELQLRKEAVEYLEKAIQLEKEIGDTVALMYDYDLLGLVYCQLNKNTEALKYYRLAYSLATNRHKDFALKIRSNIAKCYLDMDYIKMAEKIVREIPDSIDSKLKPAVLATASEIYYRAQKYDSAGMYAHKLVSHYKGNNSKIGYHILLKPEIIRNIPKDSIEILVSDYVENNKSYLKRNADERANLQNSLYNYRLHDEARKRAEHTQHVLEWIIIGILGILIVIISATMMNRSRQQKEIIKLQQLISEMEKANALTEKAKVKDTPENKGELIEKTKVPAVDREKIQLNQPEVTPDYLRTKLRNKILEEYKDNLASMPSLDPKIGNSEIYIHLRKMTRKGDSMSEKDELWEELRKLILTVSPMFFSKLEGISDGKLTRIMTETAMLIKCRFTATEISTLTGRGATSISERRNTLVKKLFDNQIDKEVLDCILWSL